METENYVRSIKRSRVVTEDLDGIKKLYTKKEHADRDVTIQISETIVLYSYKSCTWCLEPKDKLKVT